MAQGHHLCWARVPGAQHFFVAPADLQHEYGCDEFSAFVVGRGSGSGQATGALNFILQDILEDMNSPWLKPNVIDFRIFALNLVVCICFRTPDPYRAGLLSSKIKTSK